MAVSSLAVKVGAASTAVAGGGGAVATYYKWDHWTDNHLLSLEKAVLSEESTLTLASVDNDTAQEQDGHKILTVTKASFTAESDAGTWECKIKIKTSSTNDLNSQNGTLNTKVSAALADIKEKTTDSIKLSKRRWFVKNCAKNRTEDSKEKAVKSEVTVIATKTSDNWTIDLGNLLQDFV